MWIHICHRKHLVSLLKFVSRSSYLTWCGQSSSSAYNHSATTNIFFFNWILKVCEYTQFWHKKALFPSRKYYISSSVWKLSLLKKSVAVFWLQNKQKKISQKAKQFYSTSWLFTKSWNPICVKFVATLLVCLKQL